MLEELIEPVLDELGALELLLLEELGYPEPLVEPDAEDSVPLVLDPLVPDVPVVLEPVVPLVDPDEPLVAPVDGYEELPVEPLPDGANCDFGMFSESSACSIWLKCVRQVSPVRAICPGLLLPDDGAAVLSPDVPAVPAVPLISVLFAVELRLSRSNDRRSSLK